ncbi:MAG: hypothetical protein JWP78_2317 [Mucilaginibacter sp.]|nr:hypothetical protein [Mucilaginibacter sp.]
MINIELTNCPNGRVRGSRPDLSGRCVRWASTVCGVHGAFFLSHTRLKPPVAFCKQPLLNKPGITARLCEKKYDPSAARVEIFFSKPAGHRA